MVASELDRDAGLSAVSQQMVRPGSCGQEARWRLLVIVLIIVLGARCSLLQPQLLVDGAAGACRWSRGPCRAAAFPHSESIRSDRLPDVLAHATHGRGAVPRGMVRPNGVVIVSERFWAFAGEDRSLHEGVMPARPSRAAASRSFAACSHRALAAPLLRGGGVAGARSAASCWRRLPRRCSSWPCPKDSRFEWASRSRSRWSHGCCVGKRCARRRGSTVQSQRPSSGRSTSTWLGRRASVRFRRAAARTSPRWRRP